MARSIETHYDNLKVVREAPVDVIKASYRLLAQKYHPDRNPAPSALRNMQLINKAWDVLSDPERRAKHDQWITNQERRATLRAAAMAPGRPKDHAGPAFRADPVDDAAENWLGNYAKRLSGIAAVALLLILGVAYLVQAFGGAEPEPAAAAQELPASVEAPPVAGQRLPHGYYLATNAWEPSTGPATFEIDNSGGAKDAEVQMSRNGQPVHTIFVHAGRRLVVDDLALGVYVIKYKLVVDGKARAYQSKLAFPLIQTAQETRERRYNKFNKDRVSTFNLAGGQSNADEIAPDQF